MTIVNACDASVSVDDADGTLTNISTTSNSVSLSYALDTGDYNTFGESWRNSLGCKRSWEGSIKFLFSETADEARDLFENWALSSDGGYKDARSIQIDIPNGDPGSQRYTGEAFLTALDFGEMSASEPSPIALTATLKGTGELTSAVIPEPPGP